MRYGSPGPFASCLFTLTTAFLLRLARLRLRASSAPCLASLAVDKGSITGEGLLLESSGALFLAKVPMNGLQELLAHF